MGSSGDAAIVTNSPWPSPLRCSLHAVEVFPSVRAEADPSALVEVARKRGASGAGSAAGSVASA